MQDVVHTKIYGEKNFIVMKFLLMAAKDGLVAFSATKDRGIKNIKVATYAKDMSRLVVAMTPENEVVIYKDIRYFGSTVVPSIRSLCQKLNAIIGNLKIVFNEDDELYLTSFPYIFESDIKNYLYEKDPNFIYMKRLYSTVERMIYLKNEITLKTSDFERTLEELKHPNCREKLEDEFKIAQNKLIMQNFLRLLDEHFFTEFTVDYKNPVFSLCCKIPEEYIRQMFLMPYLSNTIKSRLIALAEAFISSFEHLKQDLIDYMNGSEFEEFISELKFIEESELPHIAQLRRYNMLYKKLFS